MSMQLLRDRISDKLFLLFHSIQDHEFNIEKKRQELARMDDLDIYQCFRRISQGKEHITSRDLHIFLKDNHMSYQSEEDCKFVIKYYDSDNDNQLTFIDFNYMVLVNDNVKLRALETQRQAKNHNFVVPMVEQTLADLIEMELNFHIQVERQKKELEQIQGFSTVIAFQVMDLKKFNYLDFETIYLFLKQKADGDTSLQPTKQKVNGIFRRLDLDADCKITFNEFAEAIKPIDVYFTDKSDKIKESKLQEEVQREIIKGNNAARQQSNKKPLRTFKAILKSESPCKREFTSPLRRPRFTQQEESIPLRQEAPKTLQSEIISEYSMTSPSYMQSPMKSSEEMQNSDLRISNFYEAKTQADFYNGQEISGYYDISAAKEYSPLKSNQKLKASRLEPRLLDMNESRNSQIIKDNYSAVFDLQKQEERDKDTSELKYQMRVKMEKEQQQFSFGKLLKQILECLKAIETEKELLINKHQDFNLMDAFRALDLEGKGYITSLELTSGLLDMQVKPEQRGVQAFFKQFDDDSDKKLRFSDFSKAFLPTEKFLSKDVIQREPKNLKRDKPLQKVFQPGTWIQYVLLWKTYLAKLVEIENKKKTYAQINCFDFERAYFQIDVQRKGSFGREDLKEYMNRQSVASTVTEREVELMFALLDKRECGKVTLDEFVNCMMDY